MQLTFPDLAMGLQNDRAGGAGSVEWQVCMLGGFSLPVELAMHFQREGHCQ